MSPLAHHHALIAAIAGMRYGVEDFATYPDVTYPAPPLGPVRWDNFDNPVAVSVISGVLDLRAQHNNTGGFRYATQAPTAGKYVRVLLEWYPGIPDEQRRILFEVNGVLGTSLTPVLFYYSDNTVQVGLSQFGPNSQEAGTQELTSRPNPNLQLSTTEPTWLELFVPTAASGYLQARTWGQSQVRPAAPGYSAQVSTLVSQYGPISLAGQFVARSISGDAARIRKIAILSTP